MNASSVLLFLSDKVAGVQHGSHQAGWMDAFRNHGLQPIYCGGLNRLQEAAQQVAFGYPPGQRVQAVLEGSLSEVCAAARYLRTLYPDVGIVSLLPVLDEPSIVSCLQSGSDCFAPGDASADLIITILLSLLRRSQLLTPAQPTLIHNTEQWLLCDQAWVLQGPTGKAMNLTTSERAFLLTLQRAPDFRATHAELASAIDARNGLNTISSSQGRLGVLVSRIRRKVISRQGIELPIKSLHNWGYMFAGVILSRDL